MSMYFELLKAILWGIIEGITEWLPISSTGHMILADQLIPFQMSPAFMEMFLVLIQLGAVMAVVAFYWRDLLPFSGKQKLHLDTQKLSLWCHLFVATIPAAMAGLLYEDLFTQLFYHYQSVALMLILFGLLFLLVESKWFSGKQKGRSPVTSIYHITYGKALIIGLFQMIAAIFPGTSRSGATIIGALMLGIDRQTAALFTFYLAIPAMAGASLIKLLQFGLTFTPLEFAVLMTGMSVSYLVSVLSIRFLTDYIKSHSFRVFGIYRICLGVLVLLWFGRSL